MSRRKRRNQDLLTRLGRSAQDTLMSLAGQRRRVPRLRKSPPGSAPGIEHADITRQTFTPDPDHAPAPPTHATHATSPTPSAPPTAADPAGQTAVPLVGESAMPGVYITCVDYSPDQVQSLNIPPGEFDDFLTRHRPDWAAVRWINVDGLSDLHVIQSLARKYHLHPLAVEDLLHIPQRPKVDPYSGDHEYQARLFIVCRMVQLLDKRLHGEQISIFVGHNTLLTFQETHGDVWDPIRQRINTRGSRLRQNDASFLAYAMLDAIVDHCFPILEHYGDRIHELEEAVLDRPDPSVIQAMHDLNRELMLLRRQVWPMRDVIQALQREQHECFSQTTQTYMRDVYDHVMQVIDMIETYHEIANSLAETYATMMGNKLNEVVKVLAVLTAIFTPPTFLASVYGMNFQHLPELTWAGSYYVFWAVSLATSVGMIWWFKRRGWL